MPLGPARGGRGFDENFFNEPRDENDGGGTVRKKNCASNESADARAESLLIGAAPPAEKESGNVHLELLQAEKTP